MAIRQGDKIVANAVFIDDENISATSLYSSTKVDNIKTDLENAIATEASIRSQADSDLWDGISTEASIRSQADSDLTDAIATEATIRSQAISDLSDSIATEASIRSEAVSDLDERISDIEDVIDIDNKPLQYAGELEALPTDFTDIKIGTTWKITEKFILNEKTYAAGTFVFLKDEDTLDIFTGAGSGGGTSSLENLTVTSSNTTDAGVWKTNMYIGSTAVNGTYLIFNNYSNDAQTYSSGHFLIKGNNNVYLWDVLVNVTAGNIQNLVNNGDAPVELYAVTLNNKKYYAVHINTSETFEVYYTGWLSSDFEVPTYTESDLSGFSPLALGELDLDSIPVIENIAEPRFAWSDNDGETITNYYNHWNWNENPVCYMRITGGSANSRNFRNICSRDYILTNAMALQAITAKADKPVYLILDHCTNWDYVTKQGAELKSAGWTVSAYDQTFKPADFQPQFIFLGTQRSPYEGLIGLIVPQDANSKDNVSAWVDTNMTISNLPNLKYLKLNQYTTTIQNGHLQNLPSLETVTFPEATEIFNTNGDTAALIDCDNLRALYFPNKEKVVAMNGYGPVTSKWYWLDDFNIYVPKSMLKAYKTEYESSGDLSGIFKGY